MRKSILVGLVFVGFLEVGGVNDLTVNAMGDDIVEGYESVFDIIQDEMYVEKQTEITTESLDINEKEMEIYSDVYEDALEMGYIFEEDGKLIITGDCMNIYGEDVYDVLFSTVEVLNSMIDMEIYQVNAETNEIEINYDVNANINLENNEFDISNQTLQIMSRTASSASFLNLGSMVEGNYQRIRSAYQAALVAGGNAYAGTVMLWVNLVKTNGAWDYKNYPGFKPYYKRFDCVYGLHNSKRKIKTSEKIGNYNYGYTGRLLFSLDILLEGSFVVSGFDPKDVATDWSQIREGFYDCEAIH